MRYPPLPYIQKNSLHNQTQYKRIKDLFLLVLFVFLLCMYAICGFVVVLVVYVDLFVFVYVEAFRLVGERALQAHRRH